MENDFETTGLFFNPNIHPQDEFGRRKLAMTAYSLKKNLPVIYSDCYLEEEFKKQGQKDCAACYRLRLEKTAQVARAEGFDCFSTTLLISPYQQHETLKDIGAEIARKEGLPFFYRDFRDLYKQSRALAKELNLYRQKYCGCVFSL
jgi:predicted adenine nucleotide alpha hydrolase (AANH) superfamily ATPase